MKLILNILLILTAFLSCFNTSSSSQSVQQRILPGADRTSEYLPLLKNRNIGVIVNHTSMVGSLHLVDFLDNQGINVTKIFSPEHGFKGNADAGEKIDDDLERYNGIPIKSLYGDNKQPKSSDLADVDILLFDIQDVGVRFYTYISTLHYVMQSAADNNKTLIILDRPNPLASYIDGPVLDPAFKSFVGMHPVPVVYGLTIGEYAQMINGEKWLNEGVQANINVIPIANYTHDSVYILPVNPSPNLPNNIAIGHYPSLCFFEGTTVSVGRGTEDPFQQVGHPNYNGIHSFTPTSGPGAKYPKLENKLCFGVNLKKVSPSKDGLDLSYLVSFYKDLTSKEVPFFNDNNFFDLLAGTDKLKEMIIKGIPAEEIKIYWEPGLLEYKMKRKRYLIYN